LNGKRSLCGIHLIYVVVSSKVHWHRYVLYFFEILYLIVYFKVFQWHEGCAIWEYNVFYFVNVLCDTSLLRENLGFVFGRIRMVCNIHFCSSFVACSWKLSFMFLRCMPASCFRRNRICVVGNLTQSYCLILRMFFASLYLARMW